jgi:signal transduction histidine kinase
MWAAVGNALKFTHEGSVTIRVTVMDQQEISSSSSNKSVSVDAGMCSICLSRSCFKSIIAGFPKGF